MVFMINWVKRKKITTGLHIEIVERILREMYLQKVTQAELAKKMGTSQAAVSKWLLGANLTFETIARMCHALGTVPKMSLTLKRKKMKKKEGTHNENESPWIRDSGVR